MALGPPRIRLQNGNMNLIGARVKEQRRRFKITQEALAARLDTITVGKWTPSRKDIWRIERGIRLVSDLELTSLSCCLDCSVTWLMYGDDNLTREQIARKVFEENDE